MGNNCCSDDDKHEENIGVLGDAASLDAPFYTERPDPRPGAEIVIRSECPPSPGERPAPPRVDAEIPGKEALQVSRLQSLRASGVSLSFRAKAPSVLRFTMGSDLGVVDSSHQQAEAVVRAWVGDPAREWDGKGGKDVTKIVKALLRKKREVRLDDKIFGRPEEGADSVLLMEVLGDVVKEATFTRQPLGVTFHNLKAPLVVQKVSPHGQGSRLGIRADMELVAVAGEDVTAMAGPEVKGLLKQHLDALPTA